MIDIFFLYSSCDGAPDRPRQGSLAPKSASALPNPVVARRTVPDEHEVLARSPCQESTFRLLSRNRTAKAASQRGRLGRQVPRESPARDGKVVGTLRAC